MAYPFMHPIHPKQASGTHNVEIDTLLHVKVHTICWQVPDMCDSWLVLQKKGRYQNCDLSTYISKL
uniref:Uncharacterized protein n=1 Tax=Arundo donax TaxID=35708 RepID=A0A0A9CMD1_ARUDO